MNIQNDEEDGPEDGGGLEQDIRWVLDSNTGLPIKEFLTVDDGILDCDCFPAYRELHHRTGKVLLERWFAYGEGHRVESHKPQETRWDDEGNVISEVFMCLGKVHRDHHRPAKIWYDPDDGQIIREEFWVNGQLHREGNLPAIVEYQEASRITRQEFYMYGKKIDHHKPKFSP